MVFEIFGLREQKMSKNIFLLCVEYDYINISNTNYVDKKYFCYVFYDFFIFIFIFSATEILFWTKKNTEITCFLSLSRT
ncbi:uncharacterized protein T551_00803 [Pneumocystis jirovecii RU7]|uniref:Uncharacterized protein n=1 Tax=Pneumocystis jirovecii (strain RU7) TaxID=1408657 RepID=A0A0W4ZUR3_PNEJ7|nr:uncharacterized protein T551_00803 [Pneumocystis jirovecii RU7]KTW32121.1 hypothetical protein T551_00803 [Pneumocystis jirovecii RU7]